MYANQGYRPGRGVEDEGFCDSEKAVQNSQSCCSDMGLEVRKLIIITKRVREQVKHHIWAHFTKHSAPPLSWNNG
jgi:hypothetical protein